MAQKTHTYTAIFHFCIYIASTVGIFNYVFGNKEFNPCRSFFFVHGQISLLFNDTA